MYSFAFILNFLLFASLAFAQRVAFDKRIVQVNEGEAVEVIVELSEVSDFPVTVHYTSQADSAKSWKDFKPIKGQLMIPAGSQEASLILTTLDDGKFEVTEGLSLIISDPENASLGSRQALSIRIFDDDPEIPNLLDDFEENYSLKSAQIVSPLELSQTANLAFPQQHGYETILKTFEAATLEQSFTKPQDWSSFEGLSFWYYGQNTGDFISLELLNNRGDHKDMPWPLLWADEFNQAQGSLAGQDWNYDLGDGSETGIAGWGNGERQVYTNLAENVSHDGDGHLVIRALELNDTEQRCYYGDCLYSSARLNSRGTVEFAYGRIEARMKLPEGQGIWPAFWMLGSNIEQLGWPAGGEIDIMEFIGREPNQVHGTIHGPGYSGANGVGKSFYLNEPVSKNFHTFALEWEPDELRWYIDDRLFSTLRPEDVPGEWVYNDTFYLIMNLSVGGGWPGYPDATTVFPQAFLLDYIRVYALPETNERFYSGFHDNFEGWKQLKIPFSAFIRAENQAATAPNDGLNLSDIWAYRFKLPALSYIDQIRLYE